MPDISRVLSKNMAAFLDDMCYGVITTLIWCFKFVHNSHTKVRAACYLCTRTLLAATMPSL